MQEPLLDREVPACDGDKFLFLDEFYSSVGPPGSASDLSQVQMSMQVAENRDADLHDGTAETPSGPEMEYVPIFSDGERDAQIFTVEYTSVSMHSNDVGNQWTLPCLSSRGSLEDALHTPPVCNCDSWNLLYSTFIRPDVAPSTFSSCQRMQNSCAPSKPVCRHKRPASPSKIRRFEAIWPKRGQGIKVLFWQHVLTRGDARAEVERDICRVLELIEEEEDEWSRGMDSSVEYAQQVQDTSNVHLPLSGQIEAIGESSWDFLVCFACLFRMATVFVQSADCSSAGKNSVQFGTLP